MANTIHLDVVSTGESLFTGDVELLVAAGEVGDLGVTHGHTPLLTALKPGPVRIVKQGGEEEILYTSGGFLEVQPNSVTLLADVATRAEDLDAAEAEKSRKAALSTINGGTASDVDYQLAAKKLAEALAQLRTIQQIRRQAGIR